MMTSAVAGATSRPQDKPNISVLILAMGLVILAVLMRRWAGPVLWLVAVGLSGWSMWYLAKLVQRPQTQVKHRSSDATVDARSESGSAPGSVAKAVSSPSAKGRVEKAGAGLDMDEELFTWLGPSWEHTGRFGSIAGHMEALQNERDLKTRQAIIWHICRAYRNRVLANGRRYTLEDQAAVVAVTVPESRDQGMKPFIARLLAEEAVDCEKMGDHKAACAFYRACLSCDPSDPDVRLFGLVGSSYCHNYLREFTQAEEAARAAIDLDPERYGAWKYLGVSMEHQCQFEYAAECYLKAIRYGGLDNRSVLHFRRLISEHPSLKQIPRLDEMVRSLGMDLQDM